jgi:hypothetical protein
MKIKHIDPATNILLAKDKIEKAMSQIQPYRNFTGGTIRIKRENARPWLFAADNAYPGFQMNPLRQLSQSMGRGSSAQPGQTFL